jgi:hypothetical protein
MAARPSTGPSALDPGMKCGLHRPKLPPTRNSIAFWQETQLSSLTPYRAMIRWYIQRGNGLDEGGESQISATQSLPPTE